MSGLEFGIAELWSRPGADHSAARFSCLLFLLPLVVFCRPALAEDLNTLEQKALVDAVDRVAPSVVRIETIGGLERVDRVLFGAGPTTGLVIEKSGYIISSAFNFVNKPASILVRLADGTRKPAKLVARDHNCQFVLLKIEIEPDHPLPVPEVAPQSEMRVGQWCVAVGRTFEESRPNMAVGILSAVGRVWGKALQTDAPASPNNYGGPLVDIHGRVMGLLVPLSPQSAEEIAGIEWYDSGIGFAVPLEAIQKVLPKLRKGDDLYSGVAGVFMQSKNLYTGDTVIASCRPNSPAAKAKFKGGDRIVEIGGRKVARSAEVKQEISRHYAGDKVHFVVLRGDKRIEADLELIAKLEPFQHGFLGILPLRDGDDAGITVRYVYPGSPAAEAKIEPGDLIVSAAGDALVDPDELRSTISGFEPGMGLDLEVRHKDQTRKVSLKMAELPNDLPPPTLPPARTKSETGQGQKHKVGRIALSVPEFKNEAWAYVPEHYDPAVSYGVVVWLHGSGVPDAAALLAQWKPLCDAADLVFVAPKAAASGAWQADEATYIEKLVGQVKAAYTVDPTRIVVFGRDTGASLAFVSAFRSREVVRAAAVIDAGSMLPPPEIDPGHRLAIYLGTAKTSTQAQLVKITLARLKAAKVPVTVKDLGKDARDLTPAETAEFVRWIDMLDRI
ncbi:MAG: PDZ domain-containing protein [Thermoguttaceae bacterium]|jgi:serine protease Do